MKYRSHNAATDANQAEIVKALRDRDALVFLLGTPCDLLVGYDGRWTLAEVKTDRKAKVQPSQKKLKEQCVAAGTPFVFLFDVEDVEYWFPSPSSENPRTSPGRSYTKDG